MKRAIVIIIGLALFCMAVLGVLAKDSRPGDKLYSYRLYVREPIIGAFYVVPEKHGEYDLARLHTRLQDLVVMQSASPETLSKAIEGFNVTKQKLINRVSHLATSGKVEVADNIYAGLRAEVAVFASELLAKQDTPLQVAEAMQRAMQETANLDKVIAAAFARKYRRQDTIKVFDDRLKAAKQLLQHTQEVMAATLPEMHADARVLLRQKLERAENLLQSASAKHSNDLDPEGYREINSAVASLKEIQIYVELGQQ